MSTNPSQVHDVDDDQVGGAYAEVQGADGDDTYVIDITFTDVDPLETRLDDGVLYLRVPRHAIR